MREWRALSREGGPNLHSASLREWQERNFGTSNFKGGISEENQKLLGTFWVAGNKSRGLRKKAVQTRGEGHLHRVAVVGSGEEDEINKYVREEELLASLTRWTVALWLSRGPQVQVRKLSERVTLERRTAAQRWNLREVLLAGEEHDGRREARWLGVRRLENVGAGVGAAAGTDGSIPAACARWLSGAVLPVCPALPTSLCFCLKMSVTSVKLFFCPLVLSSFFIYHFPFW